MTVLAQMIALDEDALICDLAETYGIYEYRDYKPSKIAIFANGLSEDSRIKMRISGARATIGQLVAAISADRLATLVWLNTQDGVEGKNRPKMITPILLGEPEPEDEEPALVTYDSLEEFQQAMSDKYGS